MEIVVNSWFSEYLEASATKEELEKLREIRE